MGMFEVGLRCWLRVQDVWNKKNRSPHPSERGGARVALSNPCCCGRIRVVVVESVLLWSNPCCCGRIRVVWYHGGRIHVGVVESMSSSFRH